MWRYLRGNKGCEGPRHVFSVDTETASEDHPTIKGARLEKLRLGVARYARVEHGKPGSRCEFAFNTCDQFWAWLARRVSPRSLNWVFAHGAGFDVRVLGFASEVDQGRLLLRRPPVKSPTESPTGPALRVETGLLVLDSPPLILECWFPGGAKLRIVDLRNWMNYPLAEVGRRLQLEKLEMPDPWEDDEAWLTYCRRDCEIVEQAALFLFRWQKEHDLGVFKPTLAGQAMQCFRHRFHSRKIVLHDDERCKDFEREGYYAGRLAQFYCGEIRRGDKGVGGLLFDKFDEHAPRPIGPVYKLDVNALFPSVMKAGKFPRKLLWYAPKAYDASPIPAGIETGIIARVRLKTADNEYPQREQGKVSFLRGEFETVLAGDEFVRALAAGEVQEICSWAAYETTDLFANYVDFFWQLRLMSKLAGDRIAAGMCKLMLNALYGKFAQRRHEWVTLAGRVAPEPWSLWYEIDKPARTISEFRSIGETVQIRTDRGHHPESFAAVSAFVTAAARCRMDALRSIAGWHNVYYQGVDSLFVSPLGLERLEAAGEVCPDALGKLRIEGVSDEATFLGCGLYEFAGQWTRCSIRRGAREVRLGEYEQDSFESLEKWASSPPLDGVTVRKVTRKIGGNESTIGLTDNGWVRPKAGQSWRSTLTRDDVTSSCVLLNAAT